VVVKTIDKRQWKADDACGGLSAIKQEAQALKELSGHPNIIGFIDGTLTLSPCPLALPPIDAAVLNDLSDLFSLSSAAAVETDDYYHLITQHNTGGKKKMQVSRSFFPHY
jgi:serine/threonine protein kinase